MPRNAEVIRQWNILRAIESSRRATIDGLAASEGVTTRTIRRDLEALQAAGFPLFDEVEDGKRHWRIDTRPFKALADTGFTLSELCALYFSRTLVEVLAGTPFRDDLGTAFTKFERALSPAMRRFLDRLPTVLAAKAEPRRRIASSALPERGPARQRDATARLIEATLARRRATMRYHSLSSGRTKEYLLEPYRLVYADGGLYLVANVPEYGELRTFAVDRIEALSLLEETFEPNEAIADDVFQHSIGVNQGKPERIEIEITPPISRYAAERLWHASQELEERPDGSVRFRLNVSDDWALRRWILSFGSAARVIAPPRLAEEIANEIERARALYTEPRALLRS
jgi:predicted DNA-binding transcriptional regulator YafY